MAKSKAKSLDQMTRTELAEHHANLLALNREGIKALTELVEKSEAFLREFYNEQGLTPGTIINGVQFTERLNPAKLVGATGKAMDLKTNQLIARLSDDYKTQKLNLPLIASVWDSDATVRAIVKDLGLTIEQTSSVSLKVVGQAAPSE
jgi:hypothetical protein